MFEELVTECPDLTIIEYHSLDDYSNVYSEARVVYYDVVAFPHSRFDGAHQPNWNSYEAYVTAYEERIAQMASYSLALELEGDGTDFFGTVTIGWLNANNEDKVLHLVLTESHIPESWYGGEELHYVTRLMIPDQYGTPLEGGKSPDAVYDFSFALDPGWVKDSCELVAFIQDTVTMEIMQGNSILMADVDISWFDIAIEEIQSPSNVHCEESISPIVKMRNLCHENLNSCIFVYEVNGDIYEYNWTGNLEPDSAAWVSLPEVAVDLQAENNFSVELSLPNGEEDQDPENDVLEKDFQKADVVGISQLTLELLTDDNGEQTEWELTNGNGEIIDVGNGFEDNTLYSINWDLTNDCYTFTLFDSGGDGICCENGNGYYQIKDGGDNVYFEGGEFTNSEQVLFEVNVETKVVEQIEQPGILIFPNPTEGRLSVNCSSNILNITIYDGIGDPVYYTPSSSKLTLLDLSALLPGLYFVQVNTREGSVSEKLIVK